MVCLLMCLTEFFVCIQGDIVDNIEKNVSQSVDHIIEAKEQTKKAVRYQTKARKVMLKIYHKSARDLFLCFTL